MKKVLILCTGNSCRSIIAEALVNHLLASKRIQAFSAGAKPSGRVNPNARRILEEAGMWQESYRSKSVDEALKEGPFDLVVTVCDNAKEQCPVLPGTPTVHIGFEDPDGKPYTTFVQTFEAIKSRLIPEIQRRLNPA